MDSIISKLIEYYSKDKKCDVITVPEIMPRDILSAEEIFSYVFGDADIVITEGVYADLKKTSGMDISSGFFSRKLKVNAKNTDLNVKHIIESLEQIGITDENYFIKYDTEEYQARFSNSKIISTIVYVNCVELARINYSKAISGDQTIDVKNIIEYDISNLCDVILKINQAPNCYSERLKDEFENYIDDEETLENLYLFIDRYFLDIQMHKEKGRYIMAYNTLLEAIIQNEYIRIKTGTYSDKYKANIETINEYYHDIITNIVQKYKEQ